MTVKHVFLRVAENCQGDSFVTTVLLHDGAARECAQDADKYAKEILDAELLDYWVVPSDVGNATGADSTHRLFEALVSLDPTYETPLVSDLLATLFEAGYRLGLQAGKEE